MKKKIIVKISIGLILLFLIIVMMTFINAFFGNPISAAIATRKIKVYVGETYPDMDLKMSRAIYNFKFSEYHSRVESKTSIDTRFSVGWVNGRINDRYDYEVKNHYTTYQRLEEELNIKFSEVLEKEFPYDTSINFLSAPKDNGDFSSLQLDMEFDLANPPIPITLTVYILSREVSYEVLTERMKELADILEKNLMHVDYYSIALEEPIAEGEEKPAPEGEKLYLFDFPAENLQQEHLIDLVKQHQSDWEAKYEK